MRIVKLTGLLLIAAILTGCETMGGVAPDEVKSNVEVFHQLKPSAVFTYNLMPFKEQEGKLEYATYANKIKEQLDAKGFVEAPSDKADVVVFIEYGIDDGKEVISSYPIWGQTGVASSTTYGNINTYGNTGSYSGTTYNTPSYGVVGSGTSSDTVYKRYLKLEMVDNKVYLATKKFKNTYEAKVVSVGSSNSLTRIMPYMIRSLFDEFPGESGTTKEKTFPLIN